MSYDSVVLADSPSTYYETSESSGTTWADSSGFSNAGTIVGGVTLHQPGPFPGAFAGLFDGSTGYVTPTSAPITGTGTWTLECWINVSNASTRQDFISIGTQSSNGEGAVFFVTGGSLEVDLTGQAGPSGGGLSADTWYYCVAEYDGVTNISIWLDAVQVATAGGFTPDISLNDACGIGQTPTVGFFVAGYISKVAFYPTALSQARINAHFAAAQGPNPSAYAAPVATRFHHTPSAFAQSLATPAILGSNATPISPAQNGYGYLARNRTARAAATVTVPIMPPPSPGTPGPGDPIPPGGMGPADAITSGNNLAPLGIPQVSETYATPVVIGGQPYADANRDPWVPTVARSIWATQLQIVVGGEDVTFFRGTPTLVQSWGSSEPFGDSSAVFVLPAVTSFDNLRQPVAIPVGGSVGIATTYTGLGYWQASAQGLVVAYGDASFFGDPLGLLNQPVVGIAASPSTFGYVLAAADGGVFAFGNIPFAGSLPGQDITPPTPIVGVAMTSTGNGYWLVDKGGQVYSFGDANYYGGASISDAVGIARTATGNGYYILGADGNVYDFGDAVNYGGFAGSYVAPFTGISTTPGVAGYIASNTLGEAYAAGAVPYNGGEGGTVLNQPVNSITLIPGGGGYWMSAGDGGVFTFGSAQFYGSVPSGGTTSSGSLSWLTLGAQIFINQIDPLGNVNELFSGVIASWEDAITSSQIGLTVQCVGSLFQLDWYIAKPIPNLPFQGYSIETGNPIFGWDIAQAIPAAIAAALYDPSPGTALGTGNPTSQPAGPLYLHACQVVFPQGQDVTGILTTTQPAWDKLLTSYIQNILSQSEGYGGLQYTLSLSRPQTPVLQPKDFETINWTVSTGGRGIAHDLTLDITTAANAIYGSGTAPPIISTVQSGSAITTTGLAGVWANARYPRVPGTPPAFPLAAGHSFAAGDNQVGLQPFTNWMRQCGYPMVSQNSYLATSLFGINQCLDQVLIENWQVMAGLEVTGLIDVNTWDTAFAVGTNTGAISNVWYAPLAELPSVEPYTYSPSGAFVGDNVFYNPTVPRIERYEAMGSQVSKAQGILSATIELSHIEAPTWNGTITLTADPQEGSRFSIVAGQNILLRYFHGRDVLFHISDVQVDWPNLSVQLTGSAQALDLITLAAIYARDSQAHGVSRQARPSLVNLNISSNTTTFDSESSAGLIPPTACVGGSWTVIKMGASQSGQIAGVNLATTAAETPFAVGVFSGPIAASTLAGIFGPAGPLVADASGNNPWNDFAVTGANGQPGLDSWGLLYGAGGPGGPCGYYPSDPNGTQTLSGVYVDGQTWPYCSAPGYSPWLWVAVWVTANCTIAGQFLPAPTTT